MRIGIDVNPLGVASDTMGAYIYNVLLYLCQSKDENEYFLYSNIPLARELELDERFHMRIENSGGHLKWLLTTLPKRMAQDRLDVFWQPSFILPRSARDVKTVVTVHDMAAYAYGYSSPKANITHKLLLKPSCKRAQKVIAISQSCKDDIIRYMGIDSEKIQVVYNGIKMFDDSPIPKEAAEACMKKYSIRQGEYLLFVGTLSPRKNDRVIVEGYFAYRKQGGTKKLVLAGNIAEKSLPVKEMIEQSEYRDDIILTGYISEADKKILYYHTAMLLYPSRLEGFGFPLLEAMQAKIPVITANVSCMPEIARDAALYLNNIDDSSELADRIFQAEALTPEEKQILTEKGLARVAFFSQEDARKKTLEAIESTVREDDR